MALTAKDLTRISKLNRRHRRSTQIATFVTLCATIALAIASTRHLAKSRYDSTIASMYIGDPLFNAEDSNSLLSLVQAEKISPADALFAALSTWPHGPMPPSVVEFAALLNTTQVSDAVIRGTDLSDRGIVDVGAGAGSPVTEIALQRLVKWIISLDPNDFNYNNLVKLRSKHALYAVVYGAASVKNGHLNLLFDRNDQNLTCYDCFNVDREGVFSKSVDAWTIDGLVLDNDVRRTKGNISSVWSSLKNSSDGIRLLRTNTQGHDPSVLLGATRLLQRDMVDYIVMGFDSRAFRTKRNAVRTINRLLDAGMQCAHMLLKDYANETNTLGHSFTFRQPITSRTIGPFYDFVVRVSQRTDLLCVRR